jgi:hypothetical protein
MGPIERASLSLRKPPTDEERIQLPKRRVEIKDREMDNVQNCDNCLNVPSSQAYRYYLPMSLLK